MNLQYLKVNKKKRKFPILIIKKIYLGIVMGLSLVLMNSTPVWAGHAVVTLVDAVFGGGMITGTVNVESQTPFAQKGILEVVVFDAGREEELIEMARTVVGEFTLESSEAMTQLFTIEFESEGMFLVSAHWKSSEVGVNEEGAETLTAFMHSHASAVHLEIGELAEVEEPEALEEPEGIEAEEPEAESESSRSLGAPFLPRFRPDLSTSIPVANCSGMATFRVTLFPGIVLRLPAGGQVAVVANVEVVRQRIGVGGVIAESQTLLVREFIFRLSSNGGSGSASLTWVDPPFTGNVEGNQQTVVTVRARPVTTGTLGSLLAVRDTNTRNNVASRIACAGPFL